MGFAMVQKSLAHLESSIKDEIQRKDSNSLKKELEHLELLLHNEDFDAVKKALGMSRRKSLV